MAEEAEESTPTVGVFPQANREVLKNLADARKLVTLERYAEAVRKIGEVLAIPEDCLVPDEKDGNLFRSLKTEAERLLEALPTRGRELYELEYGTTARQLLDEGIQKGDVSEIAAVSRQYFYTKAGEEAAFLVAMNHLDNQRPIPAAILFRKLYAHAAPRERFSPLLPILLAAAWEASGNGTEAEKLIQEAELEKTPGWKQLQVRGVSAEKLRAVELVRMLQEQFPKVSAGGDTVLRNWELFRGNVQRNATVQADMPVLSPIWRVSVPDNPEASAIVEVIRQYREEFELVDISATVPLVVGDTVLMRTLWNLTAVDLATGRRLWEVPSKDYTEVLNVLGASLSLPRASGESDQERLSRMVSLVKWRLWSEGIYGNLSSNGTLVFCVEDTLDNMVEGFAPQRTVRPMMGNATDTEVPVRPNRLAAYNIRSGKLIWHIGSTASRWSLPEPDTMFLGSPLPIGDELFVLGQQGGEVRLFALDAATGKTKWKQSLCLVAPGPQMLENVALSPSYANGILVCPTPNRTLVAVDIAAHAILWGNTYEKDDQAGKNSPLAGIPLGGGRGTSRQLMMLQPESRIDSSVLLAGDRVLYLPRDSQSLLCLNLSDGKEVWRKGVANFQYIASVTAQEVFLVRPNRFEKWALKDGTRMGEVALPDGEVSGFGFSNGKEYFLPMSGGSVMKIDLKTMGIVGVEKSPMGDVPGSLVPAGEWVLSQRVDSLDAFVQRKALEAFVKERYARDPNSPEAIVLEAMECWKNGDLPGAAALLRKGGDYTKKPLLAVLLEGIETDFAAFEGTREEIQELIRDPKEVLQLYPRLIIGMEKAGRYDEAMAECRKLFDVIQNTPKSMELREDDQSVGSADQWLGLHFANLIDKTDAVKKLAEGEFAELQEAFVKWHKRHEEPTFEQKIDAETASLLARYRATRIRFACLPFPEVMRNDFLTLLEKCGRFTELETFLLGEITDEEKRPAVYAQLVQRFAASPMPRAAVPYWKWLAKNVPGEKLLDGKTAEEWRNGLPEGDEIREAIAYQPAWKPGKMIVRQYSEGTSGGAKKGISHGHAHEISMELDEPVSLPFQEIQIGRTAGNPILCGSNAWGEKLWMRNMLVLPENATLPNTDQFSGDIPFSHNATLGHILFLGSSQTLMAVDLSDTARLSGDAKILWRWSSRPRQPDVPEHLQTLVKRIENKIPSFGIVSTFPTSLSGILSVSEDCVVFLNEGKITALNPTTGTFLWERNQKKENGGDYTWAFGNRLHLFLSDEMEMANIQVSMDLPETESVSLLLKEVSTKELFAAASDDSPRGKALQQFGKQFGLHDRSSLRVLDARTGKELGKKSFPFSPFRSEQVEIDGKILLSFGKSQAYGWYDIEAEKFVWLYLDMRNRQAPDWQGQGGLVKEQGLLVFLDAESRAEIRDLFTGELLGKTEPLLSGEQRKQNKKYCSWVHPDIDDGVLFTLSEIASEAPIDPDEDPEEPPEDDEKTKKDDVDIRLAPIYNVVSDEIHHASIFRFDRSGKMLWERPITEPGGWLLTAIPSKMPLVGLAWTKNVFQKKLGQNYVSQIFHFYDQRNGRMVLNMESNRASGSLQLCGIPKEQKIVMNLSNGSVEFLFTDEPFANDPPKVIRPDYSAEINAQKKQIAALENKLADLDKQIQTRTEEFQKREKPSPSDRMMFDNSIQQLERQKNICKNQLQTLARRLETLDQLQESTKQASEGKQAP